MSSSALRRLSNDDVKTVFDCVYNNKIPSNKKLQFKIIVVGPQGMKLSPPSYEFDDGLYILLRPLKKHEKQISTKPEDDPRIPHNLRCLVFTDYIKETCPWSLSGPQFPVPTSIQQRYCYPKGSPEYSHTKGGALWTVYDENGKEDLDFRLLHVYYSAKRAGNRGKSWSSTYSSSRKRRSEVPPSVELQNTPSIDVGSLASASFDSPLSFKIPSSPVDPGIFRNVFKKLSASDDKFDTNDNEPIITPDRSIFDLNPSVDHQRDSRYPSLSQKEQQKEHPRQTNSLSYHPSSHHSHYYHPYYWSPAPSYHQPYPIQTSYPFQEYQDKSPRWGSPPQSNITNTKTFYPIQQERKSSKTATNPTGYTEDLINYLDSVHSDLRKRIVKTTESVEREQFSDIVLKWAKAISTDSTFFPYNHHNHQHDDSHENLTSQEHANDGTICIDGNPNLESTPV